MVLPLSLEKLILTQLTRNLHVFMEAKHTLIISVFISRLALYQLLIVRAFYFMTLIYVGTQ
jgi:hypothetical protein